MERMNNAAARALNALPSDEADLFDRTLENDAYLSDHVASFQRVAAELADGLPDIVPAASPEIWHRIVEETGIGGGSGATEGEHNVVPIPRRLLPALISITSVAAALVIGVLVGNNVAASSPSMLDVAAAAAEQPGSTTIVMTSPVGATDINAQAVVTADGTGYVLAESLPDLSPDRTYQLWLVVDDKVISAGLLGHEPGVVQFRAEGDVVGMAISNEVAGGVVVSDVEPTVLWLQDA